MIDTLSRTGLPIVEERSTSAATGVETLGQKDFLTLLTAQMKNQDPLNPMENGEFLAQMAQFSTVAGIDRVNDTLKSMTDGLRESRMATATNLLGHQVLVSQSLARPDAEGLVSGAVELDAPAEAVIVTYSDAATGEILHSEDLGAQKPGAVTFGWAGLGAEDVAARRALRISATALTETGARELPTSVYARVTSARAGGYASGEITLEVEDFGALNALEVTAFR